MLVKQVTDLFYGVMICITYEVVFESHTGACASAIHASFLSKRKPAFVRLVQRSDLVARQIHRLRCSTFSSQNILELASGILISLSYNTVVMKS